MSANNTHEFEQLFATCEVAGFAEALVNDMTACGRQIASRRKKLEERSIELTLVEIYLRCTCIL